MRNDSLGPILTRKIFQSYFYCYINQVPVADTYYIYLYRQNRSVGAPSSNLQYPFAGMFIEKFVFM